ncbi:uncharacterized protein KD926_011667 [Aspergillus affinis]|uniref:uncharacterized protein n=1 Tax=Aspergillus affinis TaxID=1070780 RepID=UPI0022FF22D5|nr:uncharacterized protein KD926_011667 [Aspergillus affinis]KAI9044697.1 hypothetical protein KD926_011667 [Aspergillus affinis]
MARQTCVSGLRKKIRAAFGRPKPATTAPAPDSVTVETKPTVSTAPAENHDDLPKGRPQKLIEIPDGKPSNLWQRAEQQLWDNPDKQRLLQATYEALSSELGGELQPIGSSSRQAQLNELFQRRADALEKEKWRIQFGDHEVLVQDLVTSTFDKMLMVKDLVSTAASASPPAALACAGLSVVFTLALQSTQQQAILLRTLDYTSDLMCRFQVMEDVYRSGGEAVAASENHQDLIARFEDHLTDLYAAILGFQAQALHYLEKRSLTRFVGDAFDHEGWSGILQDIKDLESRAEKDSKMIGATNVNQRLWHIQNNQEHEKARTIIEQRDKMARKVLRTLYTCPYRDRKDRNGTRVPGTCEWFTHHRLFESWHQTAGSSLLWVSADPGCGKSVLAKYLIDEMLPSMKECTICYFFFKDDFSDQRTAVNALCAILRQIFLSQPHLLRESILDKFDTDGERLTKSFQDLWSIFTSVIGDPNAAEIICILDALDECQDDGRGQLIQAVTRFSQQNVRDSNIKFLVTSRPYYHIYRDFQGIQKDLSTVHLSGEGEKEIGQISKEINLVIQKLVDDIGEERDLGAEQRQLLLDKLMPVSNRTYLWVTLTIDVIRNIPGLSKGNILDAINQIPSTVNDAYEKILGRTRASDRARIILHAILAATRPLSVNEMSMIMAIYQSRRTSADAQDYLESGEDFQQTLRATCGLFVVVINSRVYLLHQTARAFLLRSDSLSQLNSVPRAQSWEGSMDLEDSNRLLAETCTFNLASGQTQTVDALDAYSMDNWVEHCKGCHFTVDDPITPLAAKLCSSRRQAQYESSLMFAYRSGLAPVVEYLIKTYGMGVGKDGPTAPTVLANAAQDGNIEVVRMILEHSVDASSRTSACVVPLWVAVMRGNVDIINLFLDNGADPNVINRLGESCLFFAVASGNDKVVDLLIKRGAEVNAHNLMGQTLLSLAEGKEAICKLLVDNGAKVDKHSE